MIGSSPRPALSPEQQAVVDHPLDRAAVVDAGAGTGKTFTIVERVAALAERRACPPDKILLLTFARKAAAELRGRIAQRLPGARPDCSTFHAFAWSILSAHAYDIGLSPETQVIEDVDARVEFRRAFRDYLDRPKAPECGFPLRLYNQMEVRDGLFAISQDLKQRGVSIPAFREQALAAADAFGQIGFRTICSISKVQRRKKEIAQISDAELKNEVAEEKCRVETCAAILSSFEERMAERNVVTYADILHRAEAALKANPELRRELLTRYPYCIVDEYQDTDLAQHRLLEALYGPKLDRIMVVGDVLQSIYAFRGAHPENMSIIKETHGAVAYPLVKNRRSLQEILDAAFATISDSHGDAQRLQAERGSAQLQIVEVATLFTGDEGEWLPADEARLVEAAAVTRRLTALLDGGLLVQRADGTRTPATAKDVAILSRTKMNVQPVTESLLSAGIPFKLVGGVGFYDAPEIRDALAWIRLLADPFDAYAVARALQSATIGLDDVAMTELARDLKSDSTALSRRVLIEAMETHAITSEDARSRLTRFHELIDALAAYSTLPLLTALNAVLERTGLLAYWQSSADPRAPQAVANLAKLETLAREFAANARAAQAADFVSFIEELERVDYDEREADVTGGDVVTISTIHAAKGLEWPIVFVLGVWPLPPNPPRLRLDRGSGALLYPEAPDGSRPFHYEVIDQHVGSDGIVCDDEDAGKKQKDAEERRLLYVALTRARDRVFISGRRTKPSKDHPQGKPHAYLDALHDWLREQRWEADRPLPDTRRILLQLTPRAAVEKPLVPQAAPIIEPAPVVPALSYSLLAGYEQCPRRITYKLMYRLPDIVRSSRPAGFDSVDETREDPVADDSLLKAGEYGSFVHKALEYWALDKRAARAAAASSAYVAAAARFLDVAPVAEQYRRAESVVARVMQQLAGWQPLQVEAPFTLDFEAQGAPLLVTGFIDLLALDDAGRVCVLDYKTGAIAAQSHALQIALYRRAAALVYGKDGALGFIGRIAGESFTLEAVEPVSEAVLVERVVAVHDGLQAKDDTAKPDLWCFACPYRKAPCQDYLRKRAETAPLIQRDGL